ncbi:MAG: TadE/TadG family type IV pilus assembly protein [Pseudomonadota bacterium]
MNGLATRNEAARRKRQRGNVAMMFGIVVFPLIFSAGIAVDFVRLTLVRAQVAEAADAALLAAARRRSIDPTLTQAQAQQIARDYFDASDIQNAGVNISAFAFNFTDNDYTITVNGDVKTSILGAVGRPKLPINVISTATVSPPANLEAVLVLDVTTSMEGSRISTLKTAATNLINKLIPDTGVGGNVKVGIVPFAQYVNVGVSRRNEPWIDVPADSSITTNSCSDTFPNRTQTGTTTRRVSENYNCRQVPSTCVRDGRSFPCQQQQCDTRMVDKEVPVYDNGDPVRVCNPVTSNTRWNGCVGSRNPPLNIEDRDYTGANRVPGIMNISCNEELLPLTDTKSSIISKIDALNANGSTYIAPGLKWGLRLLSPGEPFTEASTFGQIQADGGVKAIVVMTDGANTKSATFPKHDGTSATDANTVTESVCNEVKGSGIRVYSIAFEVTDNTIKGLLQQCATTPSNYFDATNSQALLDAFREIGDSLTELSLTS